MGITIFTPAPIPLHENQRSDAAQASGMLARVDDPQLTAAARDARRLLGARWAGVMVIVGDTQHVVASSGGMLGMYRRSTALSSYVISEPDAVFVVLDAVNDERFAGNPFVADGLIAFYAGAAIRDGAGYAIGALCVTDRQPRQAFSDEEAALLAEIAGSIEMAGS